MKKFGIASLLIIAFLFVSCSPQTASNTNNNYKADDIYKIDVYMVDMRDYSGKKIESDSSLYKVEWSSDNKSFIFIDNRQKQLRVFEANPFREIQIPDKLNDKSTWKSAKWIDNSSIYIEKKNTDNNNDVIYEYYSYNLMCAGFW